MTRHGGWIAGALLLTACAQFPEIDAAAPARNAVADYPRIVPLDMGRLALVVEPMAGSDDGARLAARAVDLRHRAALLRLRPI
ncbi:hypothetical protein EV663_10848 [Rhodovulum bhavnagarense]|uniref:Uncharacterized protein n=1 Tax=Rhodovulum bhavnagarense TaxID=992286 RepID=A0A4R2RLR7_9RHOB|nr:hypothetical protein [Rhodovulum bhavnagarense]TCP60691.1 hypothetical protein EV663_10848 [Rhodovulum bhavnagarense]